MRGQYLTQCQLATWPTRIIRCVSEPTEPLCDDLGWLLTRASHTLHTHLTAAMEEVGLTPRGRCVLAAAQGGEFTQIELAKAIGLDKTTMVVTVDTLERAG